MIRACALALMLVLAVAAQESGAARWKSIDFLFGDWIGGGTGQPGAGSGKFSFRPELGGQVVMRRNFNELARGDRHEDLMVIYAEGPGGAMHAMYFDTEGHVIRYRMSASGGDRVVFESEGEGPAYRLSYWLAGGELKGKFEVSGKTYLEWSAKKEN